MVWAGFGDGGGAGAGPSSPKYQLEEADQWVPWEPELELAQEGPPLLPLGPGPMEVDGTELAPEYGATEEEDATGELVGSLLCRTGTAAVLPIVAVGVGVLFGGHVWGRVDLCCGAK